MDQAIATRLDAGESAEVLAAEFGLGAETIYFTRGRVRRLTLA